MDLPQLPNAVDSEQLARIKSNFLPRDRVNSEYTDQITFLRQNPTVLFDDFSTANSLSRGTMLGLTYPIELDGNGGLKLSSGYDRVGQQIFEVLDTRFGERVYRPFLGTPEILFETVSESVLQQTIKSQVLSAIPYLKEENVRVVAYIKDSGLCELTIFYSTEGTRQGLVRYQFNS
jgi:phage baseplate assembly protein W